MYFKQTTNNLAHHFKVTVKHLILDKDKLLVEMSSATIVIETQRRANLANPKAECQHSSFFQCSCLLPSTRGCG